jgi:hypothetical protein
LVLFEAGVAWVMYLVLAFVCVVLATSADPFDPRALAIPIVASWWPIAWSLRRVKVSRDSVVEVRFWPFKRSWRAAHVEELALIPRELGWAGLPATSVAMRVSGQEVWFPTLQAWGLTKGSYARAERRVNALATALDVPWTDRTDEPDRP